MFFPIRCMFWLTIVFTTIYTHDQTDRRAGPVAEMADTMHGLVVKVLGTVETHVVDHCSQKPAECISVAAKLSDIAQERKAPEHLPFQPQHRPGEAVADIAAVPLPPPRPSLQSPVAHNVPERLSRRDDRIRMSPNG